MRQSYTRIVTVVVTVAVLIWLGACLLTKTEQVIDTQMQERHHAITQID